MLIELENIYLEHYSKEELENVLNSNNHISNWAFILHDKDKNEAGLKKAHYHVGIEYSTDIHEGLVKQAKKEFAFIYEKMGVKKITTQIKRVMSPRGFMEYLTHKNDKTKYQYDDSEVVTNSSAWLKMCLVPKVGLNEMCKKFMNYLNEQNNNGVFIDMNDCERWFMENDLASYFICHYYAISKVCEAKQKNLMENRLTNTARSA